MSDDVVILGTNGDLDESLVTDYLREQRWFGAQTREVSGVSVVDSVPIDDDLAIALIDVHFSGGNRGLYQVLLAERDGEVRDGTRLPELARRTLGLVASGGSSEGREGRLTFKAIRSIDGVESLDVHPTGADQSNTSTVVGSLMLKTYRRVLAGVNPELDMLLFFAEHGFGHVPNLVGWYSYAGSHVDATLGIVQCFIPDATDGWKLGLDEGAHAPAQLVARLRRLGEVIGMMHTVLAADAADPAFMPEEPTPEATGLLSARIDEEIDAIFDEFATREELGPLTGRRDDAHAMVANLSGGFTPGRMIRTHGDLHLGQTLWADDDWLIIDFEGEPARPASARRQKSFPLRDVAGMLRSISYLVATLDDDGHPLPADWEVAARAELLEGYRASAPATVLPLTAEAQDRQLWMFELEKAFYELRYELDNRPDFAPIPVRSILSLLERQVQ